MFSLKLFDAPLGDVAPVTLYQLLAIRVDVFVVEQACTYGDLDGRDLESGTRLVWAELDGDVVATLRILEEPDGAARIGHVATAASARNQGVAAAMIRRAFELIGDRPIVIAAQAYLGEWYGSFGFVRSGTDFDEDGIPHIPMRLERPHRTGD